MKMVKIVLGAMFALTSICFVITNIDKISFPLICAVCIGFLIAFLLLRSAYRVTIPQNREERPECATKSLGNSQTTVQNILIESIHRKKGVGARLDTTPDEVYFFQCLVDRMIESRLTPQALYLEPMSNQSFSVRFASYPIGKIKLRGRKTYMQILKGLYGIEVIEDASLNEYISYLPKWIEYMKYCLKE